MSLVLFSTSNFTVGIDPKLNMKHWLSSVRNNHNVLRSDWMAAVRGTGRSMRCTGGRTPIDDSGTYRAAIFFSSPAAGSRLR
jgi:hypothetical protein